VSTELDHFPIAAAVARLSEIAKEHDREGLIQASGFIDMAPTILLRGVSFLSECLEAYDDAPPMQAKLARSAIQEITALCAVLFEMDNDASSYQVLIEQKRGAP
jgi:hypothetical protein